MAAAYAVHARRLARSGRSVPVERVLSFTAGVLLVAAAIVTPLAAIGETRLFSAHMAQHLLLGDLGPLLVVIGLAGAWPSSLSSLRHPLVALPLWAANLCLWHLPVLYDAALRHSGVHALQHLLFFACGVLLWGALLLPGPSWFGVGARLVYVAAAWLVGTGLAQAFIWSGHAFYAPYRDAARLWGISAHADQVAGGGLMMVEGTFVMLGVAVWLLFGVLREPEPALESG